MTDPKIRSRTGWRTAGQLLLAAAALLGLGWRGATQAEVEAQLGPPTSRLSAGSKAIWIYDGQGQVIFRNGRVDQVQGEFPIYDPGASTAAPAAPATSPTTTDSRVIRGTGPARAAGGFRVPAATVVTEPGFQVEGTWGGASDGKTIAPDGKPLADHRLYANDSVYFRERMLVGAEQLESANWRDRRRALMGCFKAAPADRAGAEAYFQSMFGTAPEQDPLFSFVRFELALDEALKPYEFGYGQINYLEQVRVGDRIDLDAAVTGEGLKLRQEMKAAITAMEKVRAQWLSACRRYFVAGKKAQYAQWNARPQAAGKLVRADNTPFFLYQKFENTPMALGLALADTGQVLTSAKPLLLPAGAPVEVLESSTIEAPADAPSPGKRLAVLKIRVNTEGVKQHDGRPLRPMAFEGWVLANAVR